jgi:hypothetical protein
LWLIALSFFFFMKLRLKVMEMTGTLRFQLLLPSDRTDDLEREERLNQ